MESHARTKAVPARDQRTINWGLSAFLTVFHLGSVTALFFWSWQAIVVAVVLYWVAGSLGIGMGYHRLLTHRGYKVPRIVEYFLAICGSLALEGGPIQWAATHRIHHAHTDKVGDPHTPRDGRWWSHVGWVITGSAQHLDQATLDRYVPDLAKDKFYIWLDRLYFLPLVILTVALFWFGGWSVMLWGIFVRVTLALHATWLVNSATHLWGRKRFETGDDSRNSWWVALLTFGEGWHNNHHAHPTSARHGLKWYELDANWWGIRTLQFLGLARSIKRVRFNKPRTMWQLISGERGRKRSLRGV